MFGLEINLCNCKQTTVSEKGFCFFTFLERVQVAFLLLPYLSLPADVIDSNY